MKFKGLYTALSAMSLIVAPTLAAAAPIATPLTQPATEAVAGSNELGEGVSGVSIFVLLAAVAAIGLGVYVVADKNDSSPNSP